MRRRHNHKKNNKKKIIIISMIVLFFIMSAGYAAFQTNLSITAKGTIKDNSFSVSELKKNVVTSGDGLYKDGYEEGKYTYRGANPNNYITFNGEEAGWRILSIESNGTIKIIKATSLPSRAFDSEGARTTGYCSQGEASTWGCNAWSRSSFTNGSYTGEVSANSEINTYLNGEYYNTLTTTAKSQIATGTWNFGPVTKNDSSLSNAVTDEKAYTSTSNIGMITATEYVKASTNSVCTSVNDYYHNVNTSCYNNSATHNWIFNIAQTSSDHRVWTLSPSAGYSGYVFDVGGNGSLYDYYANIPYGVAPVVYLESDRTLLGEGTQDKPYLIVEN